MFANGNSHSFSSGGSYGNSAASIATPGGSEISLPSVYVRLLTVMQIPDRF